MARKKKKTTPWDIAKPLLVKDLLSGFLNDKMARGVVHKKRPEYEVVPIDSFGTNWNRLKSMYNDFAARARIEERALENDRKFYPKTVGRWDGSTAQKLLKDDVKSGLTKQMSPKDYFLSREEFEPWGKKKITDHVWQAERASLVSNYWLIKRKKKKQAETEAEEQQEEEVLQEEEFFAEE